MFSPSSAQKEPRATGRVTRGPADRASPGGPLQPEQMLWVPELHSLSIQAPKAEIKQRRLDLGDSSPMRNQANKSA